MVCLTCSKFFKKCKNKLRFCIIFSSSKEDFILPSGWQTKGKSILIEEGLSKIELVSVFLKVILFPLDSFTQGVALKHMATARCSAHFFFLVFDQRLQIASYSSSRKLQRNGCQANISSYLLFLKFWLLNSSLTLSTSYSPYNIILGMERN